MKVQLVSLLMNDMNSFVMSRLEHIFAPLVETAGLVALRLPLYNLPSQVFFAPYAPQYAHQKSQASSKLLNIIPT